MFEKLSINDIINEHYHTLHNFNSKRIKKSEVFFFFIAPTLISLLCALLSPLNSTISTITITIMSIFGALLFNVQILLCDLRIKIKKRMNEVTPQSRDKQESEITSQLIKELYSNVSFGILTALFEVIIMFFWSLSTAAFSANCKVYLPLNYIFSVFSYTIIFWFFITLLMISKRTHALITRGEFS
ncbi:MAG: hypothetical protein RRY12_01475 [Cloacibacillus sp.]